MGVGLAGGNKSPELHYFPMVISHVLGSDISYRDLWPCDWLLFRLSRTY